MSSLLFLFQLRDLVTLVRGNLSKLSRMILGALIVIEVSMENVVNDQDLTLVKGVRVNCVKSLVTFP